MQFTFWPQSLERVKAAQRIRQQLGEWPPQDGAQRAPVQICTEEPKAPDAFRPGDWLILDANKSTPARKEAALHQGVLVLEVSESSAEANALISQQMTLSVPHASVEKSAQCYAFSGICSPQWQAALAAFLDCGLDARDALTLSYAWREAEGWPDRLPTYPRLLEQPVVSYSFAPCPARLGLYAIVPSAAWVERVLACGVRTVQLRIKKNLQGQTGSAALEPSEVQDIKRAIQAARACEARLFINDYWELAIELGAYGVHLGQEDLETADLNRIAKAGLRLGLSTHGYYEMVRAYQVRPSYIALGAVFPTTTKKMPTAPHGLVRLLHYVRLLDGAVPIVAIGGIDSKVLAAVLDTGVGSAAVVRAITEAVDPEKAVIELEKFFSFSGS